MKASEKPWVVIGSSHNWGCGETDKEAISNATKNAYCGKTEYDFKKFYMDPDLIDKYWVDGMGTLNWEWTPAPEGEESMHEFVRDNFKETFCKGAFHRYKNGRVSKIK